MTKGLKPQQLKQLENIYKRFIPRIQIISVELAEYIAELSYHLKKEITLLINRKGEISKVIVGNPALTDLQKMKNLREGETRLNGIRFIRTDLRNQDLTEEDTLKLLSMRFDIVGVIGVNPQGTFSKKQGENPRYADYMQIAQIALDSSSSDLYAEIDSPQTLRNIQGLDFKNLMTLIEDHLAQQITAKAIKASGQERAVLVALWNDQVDVEEEVQESINELARLTNTAGAEVAGTIIQRKKYPDSKTYLGKGKLEELQVMIKNTSSDMAIFNHELSPIQQRNIEDMLQTKVIDRTALILDIFAQHAQTKEGKLQVELAQLQYYLPRVRGQWYGLSRQAGGGRSGGIATRGPGETQLETDRRVMRKKIDLLTKQVNDIKNHRNHIRKSRAENNMPVAALIGYTNAGKSSLLNAISKADVLVEDKLFATLDPVTRSVNISGEHKILVTDTVGFIQDLPTTLVASFRATLEEIHEACLILLVADIAHPQCFQQVSTVIKVLGDLEQLHKPIMLVANKIDKPYDAKMIEKIRDKYKDFIVDTIAVSALHRIDLIPLLEKVAMHVYPSENN